MCAGGEDGKDACSGDKNGPLISGRRDHGAGRLVELV